MRRLVAPAAAALLALTMALPVSAAKFQIGVVLEVDEGACFVATTATWSAIPLNARTWTFNFTSSDGDPYQNVASGTVPPRGGSAGGGGFLFGGSGASIGSRIDFMDSQGRIVYSASSPRVDPDCV